VVSSKPKIVSIVGITASGKSALGIKLAQEFNGEIISCDSRQVYVGLDIGSAKVTKEEQELVRHHLLDVVPPGKTFNVFDFQRMAYAAIEDILARGKVPFLVGGSGLYSRSVVEGYSFPDKQSTTPSCQGTPPLRLSKGNSNAAMYDVLQICLVPPREVIEPLVIKRTDDRLAIGQITETEALIAQGVKPEWLESLGLDYFWNVQFILGRVDLEGYRRSMRDKTMQFIKRQRTWFRKEKNTIYLTEVEKFFDESKRLIGEYLGGKN
jgi:tRNA dimethylallyltransferase